jgi:citrate lyase subunit beta/citryl-CoA lyase
MAHRSWLLVPAGNEKKLLKAATAGADVVVLDLVVAPDLKGIARANAEEWLDAYRQQVVEGARFERWVRIDSLETRYWREDLVAVMAGGPDGIILPQAAGPEAVQHVAAEIYELEQRHHLPSGSMKIVPQVADSARAATTIQAYVETSHPRLAGLAWSSAALSSALGATRSRDDRGQWSDACRLVRAQTLLSANARGIMALEMIDSAEDDAAEAASAAHADGYSGLIAGHPAQIAAINQAYGRVVPAREPLLQHSALAGI